MSITIDPTEPIAPTKPTPNWRGIRRASSRAARQGERHSAVAGRRCRRRERSCYDPDGGISAVVTILAQMAAGNAVRLIPIMPN